jgi:hypothetical protein
LFLGWVDLYVIIPVEGRHDKAIGFLPYSWYAENITESEGICHKEWLWCSCSTSFCIEPGHIIIDELHRLLQICDKLLRNLILDTKTLDDKNAVHGEKSNFLGQLTEKIRGCGVSFYIWTKKGTQGELDWSSLTGSDDEKLLENLPLQLYFLIHHDTHDHTAKIWSSVLNLYRFVTLEIHEFSNIEDIFEKCKGLVNDFLALGSLGENVLIALLLICIVLYAMFHLSLWSMENF